MGLGSFNISPSGGPRYGLVGRVVGGGENHRRPKGFSNLETGGTMRRKGDGNVLYGPGSGYDPVTLFGLSIDPLFYNILKRVGGVFSEEIDKNIFDRFSPKTNALACACWRVGSHKIFHKYIPFEFSIGTNILAGICLKPRLKAS